ncbi:MAG TPA: hypothetical protein VGM98_10920 [Schlesneria sp.]
MNSALWPVALLTELGQNDDSLVDTLLIWSSLSDSESIMLRHPALFVLAIFAACQSGCAVWMPPTGEVRVHQDESQELTASQAVSPVMAMAPGDIGQIEVGQYAKIWTSVPIESTGSKLEPRMIAGRILTATADEVVLSECVGFEGPGAKRGVLLIHKVPYVSRLFKMTGIGLMPTPIAGAVRLVKSHVVGAYPIPESEWETFQQQRHFERIGVDFDISNSR